MVTVLNNKMENFLNKLEELNLFLAEKEGNLLLKGKKGKLSPEEIQVIKNDPSIVEFIKNNKSNLVEYLITQRKTLKTVKIDKNKISSIYGLSPLQEGVLFHGLYDESSKAYREQFVVDYSESLKVDAFEKALNTVVKNHSILRTAFIYDQLSVPVQCVYKEVVLPFHYADLSHLSEEQFQKELTLFLIEDEQKGFQFDQAPLMRIKVFKMPSGSYKMIWTFHHILLDGWSLPVLMEELMEAYSCLINEAPLPEKREDYYEDFIKYIASKDKNEEEQFWKEYLKGFETPSLLPFTENNDERNKGGSIETIALDFDEAITQKAKAYAQASRVTVNTLVQGAWALLLSRYSNQEDVLFGVTVSGRPTDLFNAEKRVGLYINALPLRSMVANDQKVKDWLLSIQEGQTSAREYQYTALNDIQRWNGLNGDLFDSLLVYENYPMEEVIAQDSPLEVEDLVVKEQTNYLFTLCAVLQNQLSVKFSYNSALIDASVAETVRGHFEKAILEIVEQEKELVSSIDVVTDQEKEEILNQFNATHFSFPDNQTLIDLVEQKAAEVPENRAVSFNGKEMNYAELMTLSGKIGAYLSQEYQLAPEDRVALKVDRSDKMIALILGVLKAGAVCVPIDREYPEDRIQYIFDNCDCKVMIDDDALQSILSNCAAYDEAQINHKATPENLAYVLYTSGSTGFPKGVALEHRSLVNELKYQSQNFSFNTEARVLQTANYVFDASIEQIFLPLLNGATVVMIDREVLLDKEQLQDTLLKEKITHLHMTPSLLKQIEPGHYGGLKRVLSGGEACSVELTKSWVPFVDFYNKYGPTETTINSTIFLCNEDNVEKYQETLPIGKPLGNTKIFIVDENFQLVPKGVTGEVYIGGLGLAREYINNPALTADRFICSPFEEGTRLYKTGDKARWLPDGNIDFRGRVDDQVKIRGQRVELGEIEYRLEKMEEVSRSVVTVRKEESGTLNLVGYIVPVGTFDKEAIQKYLKEELPEYMVPSYLVEMDEIPLTTNGKVDKRALPAPDVSKSIVENYQAPRTALEKQMAEIWQQLLQLDKVGIQDNFFEIGGHSLLAMRTISAFRSKLKLELGIRDLFLYPTIEGLAEFLEKKNTTNKIPPFTIAERPDRIPLSFAQERLWFIDRLKGSTDYHIPKVLEIKGQLDKAALRHAFEQMIARHDILRTVIREEKGLAYQEVLPEGQWLLEEVEGAEFEDPQKLDQYIKEKVNAPFNLSEEHPVRATLITISPEEHILVMVIHHIASDAWSSDLMLQEFTTLYNRTEALPEKPAAQYADYAIWQRKNFDQETLKKDLTYWGRQLENVSALDLPTDFKRPAVLGTNGARTTTMIDASLSQKLTQLAQSMEVTPFILLLSAFKTLMHRYSLQKDICIGIPVAGRPVKEVESLVGFFINTLALRTQVEGSQSFKALTNEVKKTMLEAYTHQLVPFEQIVDAVELDRDMSRSPIFQVLFNYLSSSNENSQGFDGLEVDYRSSGIETAQRDLSVDVIETSEGFSLGITYATDLFDANRMERLLLHFKNILAAVVENHQQEIGKINLLSPQEEQQLLHDFATQPFAYPEKETLISLFTKTAAQFSENIAVEIGEEQITYQELNEKSNQLANLLYEAKVRKEDLIGICLEPSIDLIISILAVLKTGAAYVPVDPAYPAQRIEYILNDTQTKIILTASRHTTLFEQSQAIIQINLDNPAVLSNRSADPLELEVKPEDMAYVIYTSGSTGQPKGVMVEQGAVVNTICYQSENLGIRSDEKLLQTFNFVFDPSVEQTFMALLNGACLVLIKKESLIDDKAFERIVNEHQITHIGTTPGILRNLKIGKYKALQRVTVGGEICPPQLARDWSSFVSFYNLYGPTEGTIVTTTYKFDASKYKETSNSIPIGKPVGNNTLYILDKALQPQPIGVFGELYIAGNGVARGYLNAEELTAQKFIPSPFNPAERMYRTGDLVRWLENGTIEYRGREDQQVKLRGQRIELSEIENVILGLSGIEDCAVVIAGRKSSRQMLAAYLVADQAINKQVIREQLQAKLPAYMIPAVFVELNELPLTTNGKVDKDALPEIDLHAMVAKQYVAPKNELEQTIAEIWQELLALEKVGTQDNFFELGGHSLLATRVVSAIKDQLEVELSVADLFKHTTVEELALWIGNLEGKMASPVLQKQVRPERIPLSYAQERLWFIDKLEGSTHYHLPMTFTMEGKVEIQGLEKAFVDLIENHEVLRTVYKEEEGLAYQEIGNATDWRMQEVQLLKEEDIAASIEEEVNRPFDLSSEFPIRVSWAKISAEKYLLIIVTHHIATDGWSMSTFIDEITERYQAYIEDRPARVTPLAVQYADYAIWQRQNLAGESLESKLDYWGQTLSGLTPLNLQTDFPRPALRSSEGSTRYFNISQEIKEQLQDLSKDTGATLYMILLSAIKVLLYRYCNQQDISIGTPVANRANKEAEKMIGFFINTLVLRNQLQGDAEFRTLLNQIKENTLEAFAHEEVPFEKVVERVDPGRVRSQTPLFQVLFVLQNTPPAKEINRNEFRLESQESGYDIAKFDLSFNILEVEDGLSVGLNYATDLFSPSTIDQIGKHFEQLLLDISKHPDKQISELEMTTKEEQAAIIALSKSKPHAYPATLSVDQLFEAQVAISPDQTALLDETTKWSYRQLNERADAIAHDLITQGVSPQSFVGLALNRSAEAICCILGILKAGAIYVPIDPSNPQSRIDYLLEDTKASFVIASEENSISVGDNITLIPVEELMSAPLATPDGNIRRKKSVEEVAYVMYTSGSTGMPKGVLVNHQAIARLIFNQSLDFLNERSVIYQYAPLAFDASTFEIWGALLQGGTLVIDSPEQKSLEELSDAIQNYEVNTMWLTAGLFHEAIANVPELFTGLQYLLSGGDSIKAEAITQLFDHHPRLEFINGYGPTESTTFATTRRLKAADFKGDTTNVIGRPISNTTTFILQPQTTKLSPLGVPGEICIGGDGLAIAYLNNPALTKEKFIDHPFNTGERLYRTGDLARWTSAGEIEFLGRIDDQVKIRGYRIELGEVEGVLGAFEAIEQCCVLVRETEEGDKQLLAYVIAKKELDLQAIRTHLKASLPPYMVPSFIIPLEKFPLNANGKIDRKNLPVPEGRWSSTVAYVAPQTESEQQLAKIWATLLNVETIGIHDNFFELGGHSLMATRVVSAIRKECAKQLSIKDIFAHPTIAELAEILAQAETASESLLISSPLERPERIPLSFSQERLWFLDQLEGSIHYHIPTLQRITGPLDVELLEKALKEIVNRHEIFRTVYREEDGIAYQMVLENNDWRLDFEDRSDQQENSLPETYLLTEVNKPFDLANDYMLRARVIKFSEEDFLLILVQHHIATDGWSMPIFIKELVELYLAQKEQRTANIPTLPLQYTDFAIWQRNYLSGDRLKGKINYWSEKLKDVEPNDLPFDFQRPKIQSAKGKSLRFHFSKSISDALGQFAREEGVTTFMLLLAAFKTLLHRYTGQEDICIGTPIANRMQKEVEPMIGMFLNTLALRSRVDGDPVFRQFLQEVKETTLEAYSNQEIPFEKIVDKVTTVRDLSRSPLFQVFFVLQNMPDDNKKIDLGGVSFHDLSFGNEVAQFDLSIVINDTGDGLDLAVNYCVDLFKAGTIERLMTHYKMLLQSLTKSPEKRLSELSMITQQERKILLGQKPSSEGIWFNGKEVDLKNTEPINVRFERIAKEESEAIAITHNEETWTYQQLNEEANKISHTLQLAGIKHGDFVGIHLERSPSLVAGLLAIQKCGAVYVPLDAQNPGSRIVSMIQGSGLRVVLTSSSLVEHLDPSFFKSVLLVEPNDTLSNSSKGWEPVQIFDWAHIQTMEVSNLPNSNQMTDWAYMLFTSGSTGQPKGAITRHDGAMNHILAEYEAMELRDGFSFLQSAGIGSDISVWQILAPLLKGGKVVIIDKDDLLDFDQVVGKLIEEEVHVVEFVPSYIWGLADHLNRQDLLPNLSALEWIMMVGEEVPVNLVNKWRKLYPGVRVLNGYGPCEASDDITQYEVKELFKDTQLKVPIGRPLANMNIFVRDKNGQLCPIGVPGELCVSGVGVGAGYWGMPEKTAEQFIKNPFKTTLGDVLYRTGDLARWLSDGNLEFLGRIDRQVKIRGNRVELGEVENFVRNRPAFKEAHLQVHQHAETNKSSLIAFVVSETPDLSEEDKADLERITRSEAESALPLYMRPSHYCFVDKLPLNLSDKVDEKALISIFEEQRKEDRVGEFTAPTTEVEIALANIWKDLIEVEQIGIHDNFFEIGGDSIISIQVISRAKRAGMQLAARDVFQHQTIAGLAAVVQSQSTSMVANQVALTGPCELLPIQQLFFDHEFEEISHSNQAVLLELNKSVSAEQLDQFVKAIFKQHDALRFVYKKEADQWTQQYGDQSGELHRVNLNEISPEQLSAEITTQCEHYQRSLDITKGDLIRVVLMETPESEENNRLFIAIHHLVIDGISWRVLLDDMEHALAAMAQGEAINLGTKGSSFRDWVEALQSYAQTETVEQQQAYWQSVVGSIEEIPVDHKVEKVLKKDVARVPATLNAELTSQLLKEVNQAYNTEINDLLLAALAMTVHQWSGNKKVRVGLEGHGREDISERIDTSSTLGWFTNLYPLTLSIDDPSALGELLKTVKEDLRAIPEKGISYGALRYLHPDMSIRESLAFENWDIVFNYLGQLDNMTSQSSWFSIAEESIGKSESDQTPFLSKLEINGSIAGGELTLNWSYSTAQYEEASIQQLAGNYMDNLATLISHCATQNTSQPTPSDFGLAPLVSIAELDQFLNAEKEGQRRGDRITDLYRLSPMQEGLLFHGLYDQSSLAYTDQYNFDLPGSLDIDAFKLAWTAILANHSILKSSIYYEELSIPVQCVEAGVEIPLNVLDYSSLSAEEQEQAIADYLEEDLKNSFVFNKAPLIRIALIKLSADKYKAVWTSHHILLDGWSVPILMGELLQSYENLVSGEAAVAIQEDNFGDYIRYINNRNKEEEIKFWKTYMEGFEEPSLLPFVGNTLDRNKGIGEAKEIALELDSSRTDSIRNFARANRITVNTLVQGIWSLLLSKYTGQEDISYGVTVSGRPSDLPRTESRVGLYINAIPLRTKVNADQSITEWLEALQNGHAAAREYQYTALNDIQNWCNLQSDFFDSILVFENFPMGEVLDQKTWKLKIENVKSREQTNYLLSIDVGLAEEMTIKFGFNNSLLDEYYVQNMLKHFDHLLQQIVEAGETQISNLKVLTPAEELQLMDEFNTPPNEQSEYQSIIELFNQQVEKRATETVLAYDGTTITYKQLDDQATQLAAYLIDQGIGQENLVPICFDRSTEMIITILGILKAGAAYVPLDPQHPKERLRFIVEDTAARLVIIDVANQQVLDEEMTLDTLVYDKENPFFENASFAQEVDYQSNSLAYSIYTSGSTGQPKGVLIEQQSLISRILTESKLINADENLTSCLLTNYAFDVSLLEIFLPLSNGGRILIPTQEQIQQPDELLDLMIKAEVTMLQGTPSYLSSLLESMNEERTAASPFRYLCIGGESMTPQLVNAIQTHLPEAQLNNHYGPTETTIDAIVLEDVKKFDSNIIGRPIEDTQVLILDRKTDALSPVGVFGEICIGGIGVARGYLNRPQLTASQFITSPLDLNKRLYKTGDLGRWLPDGQIEFKGRIDEQVKVRGYRIELGEIEAVMNRSADIYQAVVLTYERDLGDLVLIAYVVPKTSYTTARIREHLEAKLPDYMHPSMIIELESIPSTPNGKVDKRALPAPNHADLEQTNRVAPRNATEIQLAEIWQRLLKVDEIGIYDNFFHLGGHSLLAMRLKALISKEMGINIDIRELFVHSTIAQLAEYLSTEEHPHSLDLLVRQERPENIPLSFAQERLWFIDQLQGSVQYHIPTVLVINGQPDIDALQTSFRQLIDRHEILRTVIQEEQGVPHQIVRSEVDWKMENIEDPRFFNDETLTDYITEFIGTPFNLSEDIPFRAQLIKQTEERYVLAIILHHIASDGWSSNILTQEFSAFYNANKNSEALDLPSLDIQYADYAIWQRSHYTPAALESQLDYWKTQLNAVPPLELPTDFARPPVQSINGDQCHLSIDAGLSDRLLELAKQEEVTPFMLLLAAFKVLLHKYSHQTDFCVGTPIAGRTVEEAESLIGFFVNTLALRTQLQSEDRFSDLLKVVRQNTLDAYANQILPFEQVVDAIGAQRDMSRSPVFQVIFNYQNIEKGNEVQLEGLDIEPGVGGEDMTLTDLNFDVIQGADSLEVVMTYCKDLFVKETIQQMLKHFEGLLEIIATQPDRRLAEMNVLRPEDEKLLLQDFGTTVYDAPEEETLLSVFRQRVTEHPDKTALNFEGTKYTYQQLENHSNRLAHRLIDLGVKTEDVIAICMDKSLEMVAGILGVMKAGGAYVPIDPEYPAHRTSHILEDTQARIVLTSEDYQSRFEELETLLLPEFFETNQEPETTPEVEVQPHQLAYIIYTSGSTGQPKGVELEHYSAVNVLKYLAEYFGVTKEDKILQTVNFVFDGSVQQIFLPLLHGAELILLSKQTLLDSHLFEQLLVEEEVTHFSITPGLLQNITPKSYPALKRVASGGEACSLDLARSWAPFVDFFNFYGPTEATMVSTIYKFDRSQSEALVSLPIGKPLGNFDIYLLDEARQLVPKGVIGEVYVGGVGLSRGYLNEEEMTAEKFIDSPFKTNHKIYKTGDLARWLPDGNLEFKGRVDDQVKIRGQRVELGEIQDCLQHVPAISQCMVLVRETPQQQKLLVAYYVIDEMIEVEDIRRYMREHLPAYMVPTVFMEIEEFPLTPNGKIDRRALPVPDLSKALISLYVPPRNELEEQVAELWSSHLQVDQIGIHDNFFELGGHSLLAMRVVAAFRETFEVEISVGVLFKYPTISSVAEIIAKLPKVTLERIIPIAEYDEIENENRVEIEDDF